VIDAGLALDDDKREVSALGQPLRPPSIENVCDVTIALSSAAR
jgi:hypothetical protein